jgi:DHA2 family methylenomycin A resistance protein-like MFS transporter
MQLTASEKMSSRRRDRLILGALGLGSFMVLLDSTILNVALPAIEHDLKGSLESLQWVLNAYTVIFASMLFTGGAFGDRFGARRIFLIGMGIFTTASLFCSLAPNIGLLIAARVIQGAGAALLLPASLALLAHSFTDASERALAVAVWAGISSLAVASGPLLGGALVDTLGWRSIFLVNVPFGLAALFLTLWLIPIVPQRARRSLDLAGQFCAMLALSALTYALIEWRSATPLLIGLALGVFLLATVAFILVELFSKQPMLPLQVFRVWPVSATTLVALLYQFSFFGVLFVFSLFFQQAYGYSAWTTGLAFLPQTAVGSAILVFLSRWLVRWLRPHLALALGMLLGAAGMGLLLIGIHTFWLWIGCGEVLVGCSAGLIVPPMTSVVLASLPKEQSGVASALVNAARQIGGALSIALLGSFLKGRSLLDGVQMALFLLGGMCLLGFVLSLSVARSSHR